MLEVEGFIVVTAAHMREAVAVLQTFHPELVLVESIAPTRVVLDLCARILRFYRPATGVDVLAENRAPRCSGCPRGLTGRCRRGRVGSSGAACGTARRRSAGRCGGRS